MYISLCTLLLCHVHSYHSHPHSLTHTHTHIHTHTHTATCMDGDVKLVGGTSDSDGRLEVCFDQRWTTVDGYGWTDSDTKVACRQLGLSTSGIHCFILVFQ